MESRYKILVLIALLISCFGLQDLYVHASDKVSILQLKKLYKRPTSIPYPTDNAYTQDREYLGKLLFFDPRISGSNVMSCATCHNPSLSWSDGLAKAVGHGHKALGRRSPTILN